MAHRLSMATVRRSSTAIRIRHKTDPTVDDTDWHGSQYDPRVLRVTLASAETGTYVTTLTPEDSSIDPLDIEYAGTGGDEPTAAAGIAAAANDAAASGPGWNFLTAASDNSSAVLLLSTHPNAPQFTPSFDPPGSATMTPDQAGTMPIVAWGDGKGNLSIEVLPVDTSDAVLAPGSGTVNLQLLSITDRSQPRGASGPDNEDAGPAVVLRRSVTAQPLGQPWVVPCPVGWYTVRISGDANLPGGTTALDVWADKTDAPVSQVRSGDIADGAVGTSEIAADAVTVAKIADGAVTPVKLATSGARIVTANGALTLAATDRVVGLANSSDTATKAATMTATHDGHQVQVQLFARSSTGSYTIACSTLAGTSGTVTLDAAGEGVDLVRISGTWYYLRLIGTASFA